MTLDEIIRSLIIFALGGAGLEIVKRILNRSRNTAEIASIISETDSKSVVIRSDLLQKWITTASDSEVKIGQLRQDVANERITQISLLQELKEIREDYAECKESLKNCQHNCPKSKSSK